MDKTELGCLRAIVLFNPGGGTAPQFSDVSPERCAGRLELADVCSVFWPQMLKDCPTPARWSSSEKRSMHHWKPTANTDTQSSREGEVNSRRYARHLLSLAPRRSFPLLSCPNSGLLSSSCDFQHCAPSAWSAWSTCSSSSWSVTRLLTLSSWKCLKLPTIFNRQDMRTVVRLS